MDLTMRLATADEFELFNEMYTIFFMEDEYPHKIKPMEKVMYEKLLDLESLFFAIYDEQVIGFAILYAFEDGDCKIEYLFVKEKNQGYGAQFYNLLEKEIRDSGLNRVCIHVFDEKPEHFWYRMGFHSVRGTEEFEKILDS